MVGRVVQDGAGASLISRVAAQIMGNAEADLLSLLSQIPKLWFSSCWNHAKAHPASATKIPRRWDYVFEKA